MTLESRHPFCQAPLRLAVLLLPLAAAGCTSVRPVRYADLASTPRLHETSRRDVKTPYRYDRGISFRRYDKLIIEPVAIYDGPDAQFGKVRPDTRERLAAIMQDEFEHALGTAFEIVDRPGPDTLRLRLTLTGAARTTPVIGPFSRFDLAGGPYNAFQSARGREGALTGSVTYAVEIFDARTGSLLLAEITKQFPNALNIGASFGATKAAEVGIRKGAKILLRQLTGQ